MKNRLWLDNTCEDCVFRVGHYCKKFPPTMEYIPEDQFTFYSVVSNGKEYQESCSQWIDINSEGDEVDF